MSLHDLRVCRWLMVVAALVVGPAMAAGIDCGRATKGSAAETICAYPTILALDSRLSSAYAAALARVPARADDLKRDEIDWLGERDREIWNGRQLAHEFPALPDDSEPRLAQLYRLRIGFLDSLGNPDAAHNAPLAKKLLDAASTLPANTTDVLAALQTAGVIVPSVESRLTDPVRAITAMAAPPDAKLQAALKVFGPDGVFRVEYLPSVGLGGAFNVGGTAYCEYWVLFEKRGNVTVPVEQSGDLLLNGCTRDAGSYGYLALVDGHAVALNVTDKPELGNTTDFQWREWIGGSQWGAAERIRFRYAYGLGSPRQGKCHDDPDHCVSPGTEAAQAALQAAQQYMRHALELAHMAPRSPADKAKFERLMQMSSNRKLWGNCYNPVWFPAHVGGSLVLGGVVASHIGCHPVAGVVDVGFWGLRGDGDGAQWWFDDYTVSIKRHGLLFAAPIPPNISTR